MKKNINKVTASSEMLNRIKKQCASMQTTLNELGCTLMDRIGFDEQILDNGQPRKASNVTLIVTICLKKAVEIPA